LEFCALTEGGRPTTEISSRQPMAGRRCMLAMLDELLRNLIECGLVVSNVRAGTRTDGRVTR